MIEAHKKENSPAGDLVDDMMSDKGFPKKTINYKVVKDYLESKNACAECMYTFEECWEEYKAYKDGEMK
jgi:uncharacterized protein YozE (UPF0346 family)